MQINEGAQVDNLECIVENFVTKAPKSRASS